jgi:serine phosphatase RsbU (regulator of sigma subunit)
MSNLQAIVRAMASEDMPPKLLCEKVNRVISNNITPGKFITDGVTEATNTEPEEFGEERLVELLGNNLSLRAAELQKKIIEAVTEFSRGDFQDDVTLITISVE